MGNVLPEIGDLLFTVLIGYIGALELVYVVRHLYHYSCRHAAIDENEGSNNLQELQENLRNQLTTAEGQEASAGGRKVMRDGVQYEDGFRVEPQPGEKQKRRKEIEAELARQKQIEEETRNKLKEAEAELENQRKAAEESDKLLAAEREREERQRQLEEADVEKERQRREADARKKQAETELENKNKVAEENEKLLAAEREREERQRLLEEEEQQELERQRKEAEEQLEREYQENERKLIETLKLEEEQQKIDELAQQESDDATDIQTEGEQSAVKEIDLQNEEDEEYNNKRLWNAEIQNEEKEQDVERKEEEQEYDDNIDRLMDVERQKEEEQRAIEEEEDRKAAEIVMKLLEAERERELLERERKLKLIEENARKFLEAEQEMVELQQNMTHAGRQHSADIEDELCEVVEEPCIKKQVALHFTDESQPVVQKVKTQFGQGSEPYIISSKSMLSPGTSDDGGPLYEDLATGTDSLDMRPDGEDKIEASMYTEDYLRSLDGIKQKPLVREDGSGRRRAFKKRRSSGSSNSSRDSRTSRDEELKMFTSLEEEEMSNTNKSDGDYTPITYANEQTLKVKGHHRRHKRSPAKDSKSSHENSLRGSLEMLGEEENANPWGEVKPEPYKNTEFWKREKATSIDEEVIDLHKHEPIEAGNTSTNLPKTSSFEEANRTQNEEALQKLSSPKNEDEPLEGVDEKVKWETKVNTCS